MKSLRPALLGLALASTALAAPAADKNWPQWRGPNGDGTAPGESAPLTWSDSKNLKWKLPLPGAGASSPVVWGDHLFLTCYSGYGVGGGDNSGNDPRELLRHVLCISAKTGDILWHKKIKPTAEEDRYGGMGVPEHGYATSTPATDGKSIFVFLGKTGVLAFDMKGNELWRVKTGTQSSRKRWGSASSPVLHGNLLLLNTLQEGGALVALHTATGKQAWRWGPKIIAGYQDSYGTPALIKTKSGTQMILAVDSEVWSLNPAKGTFNWYAFTNVGGSNVSPSVIAAGGAVFAFGGYPRQSGVALQLGGQDDVSNSKTLWTSTRAPYVASPVHHADHIYWMDRSGYAVCLNAKTGKEVYRERLQSTRGVPKFYASPILVDGKLISVSRNAGAFVVEAKPKFNQLAQNSFTSDRTVFNASPAISDGRLYLRSDSHLYCVGE
ncbi:MAG: PQQ-binding-like beta-propeller repeat protein [Verrucomicrobia subdivision 3 bacterium]|nr:PQQ-binding-like beta-propeller repeat protein [Limisphaerales bacterium]